MDRVRCKMSLNSVTKRRSSRSIYKEGTREYIGSEPCWVWDAEFNVVVGGTGNDDSQKFWEATPSGSLKLSTIREMPWEPGNTYYIDITEIKPE